MCVKYIEKKPTQYQLPPPFLGDNILSKIWKGNQEKMSAWGDLTGLFHRYMPEGSTVFLIKKTVEQNMGLKDLVSNIDLSVAATMPLCQYTQAFTIPNVNI